MPVSTAGSALDRPGGVVRAVTPPIVSGNGLWGVVERAGFEGVFEGVRALFDLAGVMSVSEVACTFGPKPSARTGELLIW
jgi:hypothetical protein